jgi:predicted amidohydrolase
MESDEILILTALQIEPAENLTDTFLQIQHLTELTSAKVPRIDCMVFPEYAFGTFREWSTNKSDHSEMLDSVQAAVSDLAKTHKVMIVAGSVPYRTEENQWRNRSFLFGPSGDLVGFYDKRHPFRAEKQLGLEPGTQTPVFRVGNYNLGILICSDLWYPDLLTQIVDEVDFLAVPTMTTVLDRAHITYGQWVWQSLVAIRSKEFTIPIVSADQAFREYAPGVFTCGGSCIADPSHRFTEKEGPHTQALKIATKNATTFVLSKISLAATHEYSRYRRNVGLREEKRE